VVHVPLGHGEVRADAPSLPPERGLDVGRPQHRAVQGGGDVDRRIRDESTVIPIERRVALKEVEWLPAFVGEEIEKGDRHAPMIALRAALG